MRMRMTLNVAMFCMMTKCRCVAMIVRMRMVLFVAVICMTNFVLVNRILNFY